MHTLLLYNTPQLADERERSRTLKEAAAAHSSGLTEQLRTLQEQQQAAALAAELALSEQQAQFAEHIAALQQELALLREQLDSGATRFSKYVDVKKENHQLRGALEGLRASADVRLSPALPRRSSKQLSRSSFGAKAREQEAAESGGTGDAKSSEFGSATAAAAAGPSGGSGSGGEHRRLSAAAVRTAAEAPSFYV
jgi:chromosome segregation ATPase